MIETKSQDSLQDQRDDLLQQLNDSKAKCKLQYDSGWRDAKADSKKTFILLAVVGIIFAAVFCIAAYGLGSSNSKSNNYDLGYNAGYHIGHENGYNSGYANGEADGYDRGYDDGKSSTSFDSYSSGSTNTGNGSTRDTAIADGYIGNLNSHKFHYSWCSYLPDQENQIVFSSRDAAVSAGYNPCGRCHP